MRNISIIKLISFFFFTALITVNLVFFIESKRQVRDAEYHTYERFMLGMKNSELDPIKIGQGGEKFIATRILI